MYNRLQSKGKAEILTQQRVLTKDHKLIAIATAIGLCGLILVMWMWRVIDRPSVPGSKDLVQAREGGSPLSTFFTLETKQEGRDQASFFIPQAEPREQKERYPKKVEETLQAAKEGTASSEQLQEGMTSLREEAKNRREGGRANEAMEFESKAIQLEAKEMELRARAMIAERESQNPPH